MALTRIKTWIAGETLSASDLNAEFNNILSNGGGSLSSPRTANFDLNALAILFDDAGTTYMQASTANLIDVYGASTLLFRLDMTVATPVNALTLKASATGVAPSIEARGSDTNISVNIVPKGTGTLQVNGSTVGSGDSDQNLLAAQIFG